MNQISTFFVFNAIKIYIIFVQKLKLYYFSLNPVNDYGTEIHVYVQKF